MEAIGKVKATAKKTVTVNDKEYELTCTCYGTMTAPVSYFDRGDRWTPPDFEPDYDSAEYEVDDTEWEYDNNFEFEFSGYDELMDYLSSVKEELMDEIYENFRSSDVKEERIA